MACSTSGQTLLNSQPRATAGHTCATCEWPRYAALPRGRCWPAGAAARGRGPPPQRFRRAALQNREQRRDRTGRRKGVSAAGTSGALASVAGEFANGQKLSSSTLSTRCSTLSTRCSTLSTHVLQHQQPSPPPPAGRQCPLMAKLPCTAGAAGEQAHSITPLRWRRSRRAGAGVTPAAGPRARLGQVHGQPVDRAQVRGGVGKVAVQRGMHDVRS